MSFSWDENVYYNPEAHDLELVGSAHDPDECYSFDQFTVWRSKDGTLYWGSDSGCSCPAPFEGVSSLDDLETGDETAMQKAALEWAGDDPYSYKNTEGRKLEAHRLIREVLGR